MAERQPLRETAQLTSIEELTSGEYIVQEGWLPNYVQSQTRQLTRVNIIGICVEKQNPFSFLLDDGTESITITDFNQTKHTADLKVGQPVLVIGKPRKSNDQLFIAAEIVTHKQLNKTPEWLTYRKEQLKNIPKTTQKKEITISAEDVINYINMKDGGDGCNIDDLIDYFGKDVQEHLETLITMGDIYEMRPGFIKVLE